MTLTSLRNTGVAYNYQLFINELKRIRYNGVLQLNKMMLL